MSEKSVNVIVLFETEEFRGDHAADRVVTTDYDPATPLSVLITHAEQLSTGSSPNHQKRATIVIHPQL